MSSLRQTGLHRSCCWPFFFLYSPSHPGFLQTNPRSGHSISGTCFYDIAFLNEETAVIVGARGRVLVSHPKYTNLWSPRDSGTKELLTCLSFVDEKNGWAAGHGGVILHTEDGGNTWRIQRESSPENNPLFDIQFLSPSVGYACGAYDTFLKTTDGGKTWTLTAPGSDYIYNGLAFLDEETGYLVGEFGTVLRTRDGGNSWEKLDLGGYEGSLFGITLLSPQTDPCLWGRRQGPEIRGRWPPLGRCLRGPGQVTVQGGCPWRHGHARGGNRDPAGQHRRGEDISQEAGQRFHLLCRRWCPSQGRVRVPG